MSVWTPKHVCVHDNQFNECIFLKKKKKRLLHTEAAIQDLLSRIKLVFDCQVLTI